MTMRISYEDMSQEAIAMAQDNEFALHKFVGNLSDTTTSAILPDLDFSLISDKVSYKNGRIVVPRETLRALIQLRRDWKIISHPITRRHGEGLVKAFKPDDLTIFAGGEISTLNGAQIVTLNNTSNGTPEVKVDLEYTTPLDRQVIDTTYDMVVSYLEGDNSHLNDEKLRQISPAERKARVFIYPHDSGDEIVWDSEVRWSENERYPTAKRDLMTKFPNSTHALSGELVNLAHALQQRGITPAMMIVRLNDKDIDIVPENKGKAEAAIEIARRARLYLPHCVAIGDNPHVSSSRDSHLGLPELDFEQKAGLAVWVKPHELEYPFRGGIATTRVPNHEAVGFLLSSFAGLLEQKANLLRIYTTH